MQSATYMAILYGNPVDFRCTRARGPLAGHSTVGRKLQPDLLGLEGRVPSLGYRVSLVPEGEHEDSHHNHGQRQQLSHGDRPKEEPDMSVRLSEKYYHEATETVTGPKAPKPAAARG